MGTDLQVDIQLKCFSPVMHNFIMIKKPEENALSIIGG